MFGKYYFYYIEHKCTNELVRKIITPIYVPAAEIPQYIFYWNWKRLYVFK